jgi:hypothetical protein
MKNNILYYSVGPLLYCPANNSSIVKSLTSNRFGRGYSLALCLEDTINDDCVEEAEEIMEDLVDTGILDEDWQPNNLSGAERALVAKAVCDRLEINETWQVFGKLWSEKPETLRAYLNKALAQRKSLKFQDRIKNILD